MTECPPAVVSASGQEEPHVITDWSVVSAVIDRLIPGDDHPSASAAGFVDDLAADAVGEQRDLWGATLAPGFDALRDEVHKRHGVSFPDLPERDQDEVIGDLLDSRTVIEWPVPASTFVSTLIRLVAEKYYGARNAPGWAMVGYGAGMRRGSGLLGSVAPGPHTLRLHEAKDGYDAVIIGAGAGGGVAASVLARAGLKVMVADRGEYLSYEEVGNDHLRNFRLSAYGHNAPPGADAGTRTRVDRVGVERPVPAWDGGYAALPHTVGGGTRLYQGMAWRLTPVDFRLASEFGVPAGSSLADWPLTYDDLEPFYARAEQEIGVCGDGNAHRNQGPRSTGYPMPPMQDNTEAAVLRRGAERLGLTTGPVPLLINSVPRGGRGQCGQCGQCVGFACPTDAKNAPFNALLPTAIAAHGCDLVVHARALEICTDLGGRVTGVRFVDEVDGSMRTVRAGHVIVACAAIETARLLLASRSERHPSGLGNHSDQVGRHLQGHLYTGAFGLFDEPVIDGVGPNVRIATCDYVNNLPGVIGGGVLANEILKMPYLHWLWALPPDAPRWGIAGKQAMRDMYSRTSHVFGPIQEIPTPDGRITLDDARPDRHGVPTARISGWLHPGSVEAAESQRRKAEEWLEASGASRVWSTPNGDDLVVGQHQAGTCRMGADPATSVTDPHGRVHGHDNLWVMDGSVHVTNGGFNPVLTILALAYRNANFLAG
jgi:choline dehydrogenase-like flavoprotein